MLRLLVPLPQFSQLIEIAQPKEIIRILLGKFCGINVTVVKNSTMFSIKIIIIIIKTFSDDIHMEFGLKKCAKIAFKRGKLVHSQNLVIDINRETQELEQEKTYITIEESEGTQHQQMKDWNRNTAGD